VINATIYSGFRQILREDIGAQGVRRENQVKLTILKGEQNERY
jgi:hypothetical protein